MRASFVLLVVFASCGAPMVMPDAGVEAQNDSGVIDAGRADDLFADEVVRFMPGLGAGFGQELLPDVVLGPPRGAGASSGSLDVLSLGRDGVIVIGFTDLIPFDGPGVDFIVFENGFTGFTETGIVAVSDDGTDWRTFPCDAPLDGGTAGCAGAHPVFSSPSNGISPTDPSVAGGDGFDLADVGLTQARFVRITDSGANRFYAPPGGGFDLDAVSVVNAR